MTENYQALTKRECAKRLLEIEKPIVAMHVHPDADTVGTAAALIAVFGALGREARYACADKIPDRLAFLLGGAKPAESVTEGVTVAVDVASPSQLGSLFGIAEVALIIDHHEVSLPFAPHYTQKGASSAAEVLYGVILEIVEMTGIKLTREIAEPLYAAISSDSGRFSYSSVTPDTYRVAAALIESGADHAKVNHLLFYSKAPEQVAAEGIAASKTELYFGGRIAAAALSREDMKDIAFEHFETAVEVVRAVRGVEIAFVVKETPEGKIKASLRSTRHDVASVAKEFSGGGHRLAAGCTVEAASVTEARDILLRRLSLIEDF